MSETRKPTAPQPGAEPTEPPEPAQEDNSLAAASADTIREIERRKEAGGYDGFGDIG